MAPTPHELNRQRHWVCALQIAERRHGLGLTQRDVIDRLEALGISVSNRALSAMEHGQGIDVGRLPELAVALECTVTYLLGMTAEPTSWEPDPGAVLVPQSSSPLTVAGEHEPWLPYPDASRARSNGIGQVKPRPVNGNGSGGRVLPRAVAKAPSTRA